MSKVYRAIFKDVAGKSFSCPVELQASVWMMQTSDGWQELTQTFQDDLGGLLKLDSYREVEPDDQPQQIHVAAGGSWQDHKNAFAAQQLVPQHKAREQDRTAMQEAPLNAKDAARAEAARIERQEFAKQQRPHGTGAGLILKD